MSEFLTSYEPTGPLAVHYSENDTMKRGEVRSLVRMAGSVCAGRGSGAFPKRKLYRLNESALPG